MIAPTGNTKVAAVIGYPVRHSLSPQIFNAAFEHLGIDWVYVAWEVVPSNAAAALAAMRSLNIAGMSVTMPHKQAAFDACDTTSEVAQALGAVNCIANVADASASASGSKLVGHNTDGAGLVAALTLQCGVELNGAAVTVLGAGGAGRAAALAVCAAGAQVTIVNRSPENAADTAKMVNEFVAGTAPTGTVLAGTAPVDAAPTGTCVVAGSASPVSASPMSANTAIANSQLIINATPLGMKPDDPLPLDADLLTDSHTLVDLIYHPAETPLAKAAKTRGAQVANGVGMLIYQAAEQFRIWTGQDAPIEVMKQAANQ